jgi:hypothetical protein
MPTIIPNGRTLSSCFTLGRRTAASGRFLLLSGQLPSPAAPRHDRVHLMYVFRYQLHTILG